MFAVRRYPLGSALVLLSLLACDRGQPVEPSLDASSASAPGLTVNAPSDVKVTAASVGRIDISWRDNSTNERGFEVWRSSSGVDGTFTTRAVETAANVTTASDAGVDAATPYCYEVRAFKRLDSKPSQAIYATLSVSCTSPATLGSGTNCTVTVTDNSPGTYVTPTGTVSLTTGGTGLLARDRLALTARIIREGEWQERAPGSQDRVCAEGTRHDEHEGDNGHRRLRDCLRCGDGKRAGDHHDHRRRSRSRRLLRGSWGWNHPAHRN